MTRAKQQANIQFESAISRSFHLGFIQFTEKSKLLFLLRRSLLLLLLFGAFHLNAQNPIVVENLKPGNPSSEWDIVGAGDLTIQGFATDISVNKGERVQFKIKTNASAYTIDIYRLGYYQGNGARRVGAGVITAALPQSQPVEIRDNVTGLVDCGNWAVSAHWDVPTDAVSGIYLARLKRDDNDGASHIVFIVRDDASTSDLYFQTSDATWQAYNAYGGASLYVGSTSYPGGHAVKVSYNRPFLTRNGGGGGGAAEDWLFNAEYPMLRWLERNGYDVTYTTNVDADRRGHLIKNHKVFLSVGHDEYWSAQHRANVEAARDAGVHLAFFSGNEVYWKTRWEASKDQSATAYRTLVCYKEGNSGENICGGKCDPLDNVWTGLWRSGCDFPQADGCKPENALTGQISWVEATSQITVPGQYRGHRFWRNTTIANLANNQTATFVNGILGYELDYEQDNGAYPPGRVHLSETSVGGQTHKLSLYRHSSGALVFGAGTVQWSWGLDGVHDRGGSTPDVRVQQATINLLADMGVQPASIQSGLTIATGITERVSPISVITTPTNGSTLASGAPVTISGTASESSGVVAGVEISVDGGATWKLANGTTSWSFTWTPQGSGAVTIKSRSFDDMGNLEVAGTAPSSNVVTVNVGSGGSTTCPCTIFQANDATTKLTGSDGSAIELGVKFRTSQNGYITGIRFYKPSGTSGTHIGHLWSRSGTKLAEATFINETASGWQQVLFSSPIAVTAGTTYVASYHSSTGAYVYTDGYFTQALINGPLRALADGEDGANGVYIYSGVSAFPASTYQSSNYWVDVVFNTTVEPDVTPPTVVSTTPSPNATGINPGSSISALFSEIIEASTVNTSTVELRQGSTLLPAGVNYDAGTQQVVITPSASLAYLTTYTVTIKGGSTDPRIKDLAGNALAANYTWSFTTGAEPPPPPPPPPPPTEGSGGPILVISSSVNPFSRYPVEILRAEGWNAFMAKDISQVTAGELSAYDAIILGEISLTAGQIAMFEDWVAAGGTLIALRPDVKLAPLMGITIGNGTLSNGYLKVNTASEQGKGIVGETIQYHGPASLYTLNGATVLATLYSNANTATSNAAVTIRNVGSKGGQAIAFAYDLARSVVYTRQGNPNWAGQKRDGQAGPKRSDDMYFGSASFDPQIDWVDLNKVAIPQADEQQRLLTNIIIKGNEDKKPLPRFWFLPRGLKAAIVMTGDDHGNGGTAERFNQYKALSPSNTADAVADWRAVRGSSYVYPNTPITNTQVSSLQSDGFEIGLHLNTNCDNWTPTALQDFLNSQLSDLSANYPGVSVPSTNRTHCIAWSDWITKAKVQSAKGIRLDVNYYYWPGSWIQNRPGMFTGSGMPMRFADLDGSIIDCYQVATQMTDESDQVYPGFIDILLDKAIGQEGYYGVFCANMHTDNAVSSGSDAIINSALTRSVPVVSSRQMLSWLDSRNGSTYGSLTWDNNVLSFTITASSGARGLEAMLPYHVGSLRLKSVSMNGATQTFRKEDIKGVPYAFFPAATGNYVATYETDPCLLTPTTATLGAAHVDCESQNIALKLTTASGQAPYKVVVNGVTYSGVNVGQTFATIPVAGEQRIFGSSDNPDNTTYNDGQPIEVGVKFRASQNGSIIGIRFYKGSANTGTHTGSLWTSTGARLASATFINETASGWQEVRFATPVAIAANTTYVASYLSPGGGYAASGNYFTSNVTSGALTALQSGADGSNGLYKYGGGFPDQSFNSSNYWVDVLFKPNNTSYTFTLSKITDANDCENTGNISSVTVAEEDMQIGQQTYYQDKDNDGYGNTEVTQKACTLPSGYVVQGGDCNDNDAAIKPGAAEVCDNMDNDCDGQVDEGITKTTYYRDSDNDGFGSSASTTTACTTPAGYVAQGGDCNDSDATVNPGAAEVCGNGKDDNCDGQIDEGLLTTYYRDADADGFGLTSDSRASCSVPQGYVDKNGDCIDSDNTVYPGAVEVCDGKDNDCDGTTDEGCAVKTYYLDSDQDGFGDLSKPTTSTSTTPPAGYVANSTDCNDSDAAIKPGATEVCDGKDNDCDGQTDEGVTQITYYLDADADGYGTNSVTRNGCTPPAGYVAQGGDCNDSDATIKPGATEVCDGKDNDCDGTTDEGCAVKTYYLDSDQDGFGDLSKPTTSTSTTPPAGYVANSTDCNDSDAAIKPGATEVCDGKDNDCDGQTDEGVMTTYYRDADGDGYGTSSDAKTGCTPPAGYVALGGDCDDNDVFVYPGLKEFCDGKDNNCNGKVDERCKGSVYYRDSDGDSYGDPAVTYTGTTPPSGYVLRGGDCNDSNGSINPGVVEKCGNGIDDNCNGQVDENCIITTYYRDGDGDSYGDPAVTYTGTTPPAGYIVQGGDCNDNDITVKPGASEVCGNGKDDNCNGIVDEGCTAPSDTYYRDGDGDGYGDPAQSTTGTTPPPDYVANSTDCNDSDAAIKPGATEICDGKDNDCDGLVDEGVKTTYYRDLDGDGFGSPNASTAACTLPAGYVANSTDCNDSDAAIKPGATEICDGKDNDCDGLVDEGCNVTSPTMSISNVSVYESERTATLTVSLSQTNTQPVTVNYTCVNGSAIRPNDYKLAKGTLTIAAGSLSGTIMVSIVRDALPEDRETFTVQLSSPVNATIAVGTATVTILDGAAPVTMTKTIKAADAEVSTREFKAEVFPNPSLKEFNLVTQSSNTEPMTLRVWDILGRLVELRKGVSANGTTYFGHEYRVGVYYAELIQGRERKVVKLLKLKESR